MRTLKYDEEGELSSEKDEKMSKEGEGREDIKRRRRMRRSFSLVEEKESKPVEIKPGCFRI